MKLRKFFGHLNTVNKHRLKVLQLCICAGIPIRGLLHDLSKFTPTEFIEGVKYYTDGKKSPISTRKKEVGYSNAWLHHKGRNKHHYEYWIDYNSRAKAEDIMIPVPMPKKYIAEMVMDRIAASKVYMGKNYTDASPLEYYYRGTDKAPIHEETRRILLDILNMLAEKGEKETFQYVRRTLLK